MTAPASHIARESLISVAINAALSLLFFLLVFGIGKTVPVQGIGNFAFDFLPQSLMIGLMAGLVPGMLARKAIVSGRIAGAGGAVPSAGSIVRRSLVSAFLAMAVGAAIGAMLLASGLEHVGFAAALVVKVIYGGTLGSIVTRLVLGRLLA